ncbi:MAG: HPF/RaiA family ribosome-associated protein, partial [Bdellovibrionia bacterium]
MKRREKTEKPMEVPLRLTFKNLDPSNAVASHVRELLDRLAKFYPRIVSCLVIIEVPHRNHQKGNLFLIHIILNIPGGELAIKQHQKLAVANQDIYVAIHEAFDRAKRGLDEHNQIQNRQIKKHSSPYSRGHVARLLTNEEGDYENDYGFLETEDGRDIYFHRHAVLGKNYDQLEIGTEVRFIEEQGDLGPQAST